MTNEYSSKAREQVQKFADLPTKQAEDRLVTYIVDLITQAQIEARIDENEKWRDGTLSIHGEDQEESNLDVENIQSTIKALAQMHIDNLKGIKHELPF